MLWRSLDLWIQYTSVVGRVPAVLLLLMSAFIARYSCLTIGHITAVSCLRLFTYRVRCVLARFPRMYLTLGSRIIFCS